MARIQAGSTLVNQYAPPFVVSDSIVNGWVLQWNETLKAFEAVDPDANTVYAGFNSIEVYRVENANQQTFVAPFATDSKESTFITIDGVKQQQDAYTWTTNTATNTTTVTLDSAVQNETVEILGLIATTGSSVDVYGPFNIDSVVAGTVNASYDIDWWAPTAESLIVTVDGVKQHSNVYNVQPVPGSNFTATRVTFPDRTVTFSTNSTGIEAINDVITTDTVHGFETGDGVYYSLNGGSADIGVGADPADNTLYYVREGSSVWKLTLHTTRQGAIDDTNKVDLQVAGNETHTLTLVSDPFLYVDTIAVGSTGGTGYAVGNVVTLTEGVFNTPAQITVTEVDNDADIIFSTDGSGNIALGALTINDGGSGYQISGGGTFNITNNTLAGNGDAIVTYTTDVTGAIDSASVTTQGTGYTINQTDVSISDADLPLQNGANSGEITNFNFDFIGEYITFPSGSPPTDVTSTGGAGSGAVFNITKGVPRIEILGITTLGGAPASPVDATNLGVPIGSTTIYGLYDSKTVSGDAQVLNFKGISEGTGITLSEAGDTVQISAATALGRDFDQVGSGTSLFDANNEDANPVIFRRIGAGDGISISVPSSPDPQTDTIVVARNFNYAAPTSAATLGFDIAIPSTARIIGVAPFAGGTTLNLLAASELTAGDTITINDRSGTAGTHSIIVTPDPGDTIFGSGRVAGDPITLSTDRAYITLYSDGSDWHIIGQG